MAGETKTGKFAAPMAGVNCSKPPQAALPKYYFLN
jgi:hypothetical protein